MQKSTQGLYKKYIHTVLLLSVIVSIIPFLVLCLYIHPQGDDYQFINLAASKGVLQAVASYYNNWGGRFALYFFDLLMARGFSNIYFYRISCFILITLLGAAFYLLIHTLFNYRLSKKNIWLGTLLFFLAYLSAIPEISTLFYYVICGYSSLIGSILFIGLITLSISLLHTTATKKKTQYTILASLATFCIGGYYEPVYLMTFVYLAATCLVLLYKRDKNLKYFLIMTMALVAAIIISVIAPGNNVRGGQMMETQSHINIFILIAKSLKAGSVLVLGSLKSPTLLLTIILFIPAAHYIYNTNDTIKKYLTIHPVIPFLGLFAVTAAGCFPCFWSIAFVPKRVNNQILLFLVIAWFVFIQTLVNYAAKRNINFSKAKNSIPLIQGLLILSLVPVKYNMRQRSAIHDAFIKAPDFNRRMNKQDALVHKMVQEGKRYIIIPPLYEYCKDYPYSIFWWKSSLRPNPKIIFNQYYSTYLGIDSISLTCKCNFE